METTFTPYSALIGGVLIGASATLMLLLTGRIAGVSGVFGGILEARPGSGDIGWRAAFLVGLVLGPALYELASAAPVAVPVTAAVPTIVIGGLLVGVGTRLGSGCTSGHGVCGLGRRSPRSAAAVAVFLLTGFGTVFVARHLLGA